MKRAGLLVAGLAAVGLLAWQAAPALQNVSVTTPKADPAPKPAANPAPPSASAPAAKAYVPSTKTTPMADRVAVVGLLNKRNGLWRDLTLKPGQAVRIGDAVVRLQACETTAPWETEQLTGAFVQMTVQGSDRKWRRVFSGWLFKETPSLNAVEHPIYDVWTKDCQMRHIDTGAGTKVVTGDSDVSEGAGPRRSSTRRSAPAAAPGFEAAEPVEAPDVAEDNSDI